MPETLWINRVKEFGPLIISIDTKGKNLIEENKAVFNKKRSLFLSESISKYDSSNDPFKPPTGGFFISLAKEFRTNPDSELTDDN